MTAAQLFYLAALVGFVFVGDKCYEIGTYWATLTLYDRLFLVVFSTMCAACGLVCGWQIVGGTL